MEKSSSQSVTRSYNSRRTNSVDGNCVSEGWNRYHLSDKIIIALTSIFLLVNNLLSNFLI